MGGVRRILRPSLARLCTSGRRPRMEEVVLVRHGESEGNVAFNRSMAGDHSLYSGEFLERHSSLWRLTDRGRAQALTTGEWMRANVDLDFDAFVRPDLSCRPPAVVRDCGRLCPSAPLPQLLTVARAVRSSHRSTCVRWRRRRSSRCPTRAGSPT
jgi:hypothetical protein